MPTMTSPPSGLSLDVFRDPTSVAVVGASANPAKWGYWLATGALAGAGRRRVDLVNRTSATLFGHACSASLSDLEHTPDLVALCTPGHLAAAVVDEALAMGVRGFLGITAGIPDEAALARRIRAGGARLIGANSLGIVDTSTDLRLAWGTFAPGSLSIVSQSGQLGSELAQLAARAGLGIARFVSVGNQSDVVAAELLADLVDDPGTRVVALYLESFTGGEVLFDVLAALREAGKPVFLLTVGASAASSRLARSHTGSLTSRLDRVDAACRATGVVRVDTPRELIDAARVSLTAPPLRGRRIAVVGDSGGQCGIAADVAAAVGLELPELDGLRAAAVGQMLPAGAAVSNPVDLAGAGEADMTTYHEIAQRLLTGDEVDAVVMTGYFGRYGMDIPELSDAERAEARELGATARQLDKPVYVHTMGPEGETAAELWANGVPAFGAIEDALRAATLVAAPVPARPDTAVAPVEWDRAPGYLSARSLLERFGARFPTGHAARTRIEAEAAALAIDAPVVLKAAWLEHKSEVGGVAVGLSGVAEVGRAFDAMHARLGDGEYVVEAMDGRADTVEMLVGASRDAQLGPMIVVGAGGVQAEMLDDVAIERAPVDHASALAMIGRLRCSALLDGWRGRPACDVDALAATVVSLSHLIAGAPQIAEIELNPVRVGPDGAIAVDALIIPSVTDPSAV